MQENPQYLYHYTTIESLSQILSNQTIRFNSLNKVDDANEGLTEDFGFIGNWFFVSCWTDDEKESIPMWKMYSSNMKGVRLKLPVMPFAKSNFNNNDNNHTYSKNEDGKLLDFVLVHPKKILFQITYQQEPIKQNLFDNDMTNNTLTINMNSNCIGEYKSDVWYFQNEWRYKLFCLPLKLIKNRPASYSSKEGYENLLESLFLRPKELPRHIDEKLSDSAINDMEILLGPLAGDAEKEMVKLLTNEYAPKAEIKYSELKIRNNYQE